MRSLNLLAAGLLLSLGSLSLAAPVSITAGFLTTVVGGPGDKVSYSSDSGVAFPHEICPPDINGCGGGFEADITNSAGTSTIPNVSLWCVDSQLDVGAGYVYTASIVSLVNPASAFDNGSVVRYGSVGQAGNPSWTNNLGSSYTTALSRYDLAATLIMQYQSQGGTDYSAPANSPSNQAIQNAIWEIMENGSYPTTLTGTPDVSTGVTGGYSNWITWAEGNVASTDLADWAVVSGKYNQYTPGSSLYSLSSSDTIQTFLAEVIPGGPGFGMFTPEPGFYGILAIGFVALVITTRRSRRSISN